jgi:trehalose 6-phosphate phosphatase
MTSAHPNIDPTRDTLPLPSWPDPATSALFLDVDGTLLDFAASPGRVVVDATLPPLLQSLSLLFDGALAPISGRPLHEIDALLQLPRGAAAGLHGAELRRGDGTAITTTSDSPHMLALRERATRLVAALPGVFVESKPDALALHYRNAPTAASAVRAAASVLEREAGAGYVLQPGNHVIELKPAGTDKGSAVAALMQTATFAGRTPWVLGDDLTDEHAFAVANALGGISVIVGTRRPTAACRALVDPRAAQIWLAALRDRASPHPQRSASR